MDAASSVPPERAPAPEQNGAMTTESASAAHLPDHEIPTMAVDELRATQLDALQETVRAAYANVAHYRASPRRLWLPP